MISRPVSGPRMVTAVSFAVIGLGTAPPALMGYLGALIRSDLRLSRAELGLVASVFYGATGLSLFFCGRLCELLGARRCAALNVGLLVLAMAAIALRPTYATLLAAAVVAGASYALGNVSTNVAVSALSPPGKTAILLAVKTAGVPAVAAGMALAGPALAQQVGWRGVAGIVAGLSAVLIVPVLLVMPDSRRHSERAERQRLPQHFWWLPVGAGLLILGSQPLNSWLAIYLHDAFKVSVSTAGDVTAVGSLSSIALLVIAARLTDRLGPLLRCALVAITCLVCSAGVVLTAAGPEVGLGGVMVGALVGMWGNLVAAGLTHALVVDRVPYAVGRASGVALSGYYLGALVAPVTFGLVTDAFNYSAAWLVSAVALALAAFAYWRVQVLVPVIGPKRLVEVSEPA